MNDELSEWQAHLIHCARSGEKPQRPANRLPEQPVLIVAGSCKNESGEEWRQFFQTLEKRLASFCGTVISGGTLAGVCAEVGRLSAEIPKEQRNWTSIGYLPRSTPPDLIDNRYDKLIFTDGRGFSEIEPLQYWTDILASGVPVSQMALLRYGGGTLSEYEEQLFREFRLLTL